MHHLESKNPVSSIVTSASLKEYVKPKLESFGTWDIPVGQTGSIVPCNPALEDCGLPGGGP
jgi:hypothetical protein